MIETPHTVFARSKKTVLLSVAMATVAATVTAAAVPAPAPTPPALIAASQRGVNLTASTSPYQLLQDVIDAVLPTVVNTFGAKPTVTLQSLLAQVPPDLLTDVLNANGGAINVSSLLSTLGASGSDLNTTVTNAITSALTDYLNSATTGSGAAALTSELSSAISSAVASKLNSFKISVAGFNLSLADIVGSSGVTSIANGVANTVAGNIVANLSSILPTPEQLAGDLTPALPNLLNTVLSTANLTDANGNFQLGNLLNLLGVNLSSIEGANALTVTSAGPLFTLARLFGGVDLGWVPGTETAIAKSVNSTGYLDVGTATLKANLAAALAGALSDGTLASSLTDDLTPVLNTVIGQIVDNATGNLESDLTSSINGALSGLNYTYKITIPFVGTKTITVPVGSALQSAVDPLISGLASSLNGGLQGSVSGAIDGAIGSATGSISDALDSAVNDAIAAIPDEDIANVRIPIVIGTGLGAFSAGAAYKDVLAQLSSQPGGADYTGTNSLLGSLTLMPELLLNNAGRANGGVLARFASILKLFGIDAVTPDVAISSSGGTAIGNTGLALGGANLIPIKIDATAEYQLMSDFAAWPNPFTLVNNVAATVLPTYLLRGLNAGGALSQVTTQLESLVSGLASQNSVDPNIYLTIAAHTLPMLEPLYLVGDVLNLTGLKPVGNVVDGLANALSPALTSLVNLGYSDAYWNPATGQYERTLDTAATKVQFGTLPNVNWSQVVPNLLKSLVTGFQKAFTSDNSQPNALQTVISGLSGGSIADDIGKVLSGVTGAASTATTATTQTLSAAVVAGGNTTGTNTLMAAAVKTGTSTSEKSATSDDTGTDPSASDTGSKDTTQTKAQRKAEWQTKRAAAKAARDAGTGTNGDTATAGPDGTSGGSTDGTAGTGTKHSHKGEHKGEHGMKASAGSGDSNSNNDGTKGNSVKHHGKSGTHKHAA